MERVLQILEEDRRMTCEEIAHSEGISPTSAYRIVTERLHKRRIAARWVSHDLSEEQKCRRLEIAQQLLDTSSYNSSKQLKPKMRCQGRCARHCPHIITTGLDTDFHL